MVVPWKELPLPTRIQPVQRTATTAQAIAPDMAVGLVAYPGTILSSQHHYTVFMRGTEPFASRLYVSFLIEAESGKSPRALVFRGM